MNERIIQGFPLSVLWYHEDIASRRLRDLSRDDADLLIMESSARIVLAQVGATLFWLRREDIHSFWKQTPKSGYYHTARSHEDVLDKLKTPNYVFYASEWEPFDGVPLVLLEGIYWPHNPALKLY